MTKKIIEGLIVGAMTLVGSFVTTSFTLGQYKTRFEAVEKTATTTAEDLNKVKLDITDRLARIETKLDEALEGK